MKWYKITFFYKGKQESIIIKSLNRAEAIIDAKKMNKGLLIKVEEIPMPFEERVKLLKDLIATRVLRKKLKYPPYISALRQLAVLLKAGISLKDSLEDIAKQLKDEDEKYSSVQNVLDEIYNMGLNLDSFSCGYFIIVDVLWILNITGKKS